jgi:hypothetical protein
MENVLTTIPKQTTEKTLNSSHNYIFKHQILLASIYSQVAISIKVGAAGHFQWSVTHNSICCFLLLVLISLCCACHSLTSRPNNL